MFQEKSSVNEQIRHGIRQGARQALSKDELVQAVFDTFDAQHIDLRNVSLEDMKAALVDAARVARK